ncbi:MAG TPA: ABC transporter permease [Gemmataceae bacterium]|nr:ABC transporter permease [Gemmataceae bacterium]
MSLLTIITLAISIAVLVAAAVVLVLNPRLFLLIYRNLGRNFLRTSLTSVAIVVLVIMVTMIWTVVSFLDASTAEQSQNIKLIVTERWQLPSQMPSSHADYMDPEKPNAILPELKPYVGKDDFMTWSFYGGSTEKDPSKRTRDNLVFMFAMNPEHIRPMMDDLQDLDPKIIEQMQKDESLVLLGKERLEMMNMKVGDKFTLVSMNYKGIDLKFTVGPVLPGNRYNLMGIMNANYFNRGFDTYRTENKNQPHPLENRRLNLIWLRVRDKDAVAKVGGIIENSPTFSDRPLKCETASSGIAAFLDAYRDLLFGMKWLLVPAILISMTLVISNAIAITVRERRTEMAVLKVLGFRPLQILVMVLGEAVLVGGLSGFIATLGSIAIINWVFGGIPFPIAFFPAFTVPLDALAWGFAIGAGTGLLGSCLPAWTARSVKVSEVFAKVA